MGYTTEYEGYVSIEPPLNEHEISFLNDFNQSRRMDRRNGPLYVSGSGFMGQGRDSDVVDFNRPHPDQPGLWCQWIPSDDGSLLEWDGGEKFYYGEEWMNYIVNRLLSINAMPYVSAHIDEDERLQHFTCDHVVNGVITAQGEEASDMWRLKVTDNVVTTQAPTITWE